MQNVFLESSPLPFAHTSAAITSAPLRLLAGTAVLCALLVCCACPGAAQQKRAPLSVSASVTCMAADAKDQDDMCLWLHPDSPGKSTVITSDKKAGKLFVYDLDGKGLQKISLPKPGNIDLRHGFPLGGKLIDIVAVNQRKNGYKIRVYAVDPYSRNLRPIDSGGIPTGKNYGGCLYHSTKTGDFYFVITSRIGFIEQYRLYDTGRGSVAGSLVRSIPLGPCEGIVAHDESLMLYVAEEKKGVWAFGAEPEDPAAGTLIASVGENGLTADVEGLTICKTSRKEGFLIASSQGNSIFCVFKLAGAYPFTASFTVEGVQDTDGIDVLNAPLGKRFPHGIFACHNGRNKEQCSVVLVPLENIPCLTKNNAATPHAVFHKTPDCAVSPAFR